jgi:PAS domain S-box-containing protein
MVFPYLRAYAAFILENHLDEFIRINIARVKEVKLPLLNLFADFSEEQLFAYSRNSIEPFLKSLAEGTAIEQIRQSISRWKANEIPNVPRNSIDTKDMAFSPHTRKYAFIQLLKQYTADILTYEAVVQELDTFYAYLQEMGLQAFVDIQQELLRKEKDFITTILDNTLDGISAYDTEGRTTVWNKALEKRTGINRDTILGKNLFSYFKQYEGTEIQLAIERVLKGEKVTLHDMPLKERPGYYEASLTPLVNDNGEIIGGVTISRDITERKLAEARLTKSEAIMAQAQSIAHFGSWEWELETNMYTWSDELYRIFGYKPQSIEISTEWIRSHIKPESLPDLDLLQKVFQQQKSSFELTTTVLRKDKTSRTLHTRGLVIYNAEGRPARIYGASQDVTEEMEMQLLIQGVLNGSLAGLIYIKAIKQKGNIIDFEYVLVNEAAYRFLQRHEHLIGKRMLQEFPGIKETVIFQHFQEVVASGIPYADEIFYTTDSFSNWFKIYAVPHKDGLVLSFEDITAIKDAERKLQQEKEFSESLISHNIDGIVTLDTNLYYTTWNPVIEKMTGKPREQVLGRHVLEIYPGTEHSEGINAFRDALQGKSTSLFDRKYTLRDGYFDSYIFPLYNNEKQITGVMSIIHDISERKLNELKQAEAQQEISKKNQELAIALKELSLLNNQLEEKVQQRTQELMKNENQLRLITNALPILIAYIDQDKRYRFNNKVYEEWFNISLREIEGITMQELVGEEVFGNVAPYVQKALQGENVQFEISLPHSRHGSRYVSVNYIPHAEQDNVVGFYAVVIDISERVINEKALQTAFAEMEQKNKELTKINELLDNFVYMAAHDLKSPVANLKLLSGMMVRTDKTVHPELHAAIIESINRLDNTINGLVEVIEVQSVHDIPVKVLELGHMLSLVIKDFEEEIKVSATVIQTDFSKRSRLRYVEAYLLSIIKNLISNAIKYRSSSRHLSLEIFTEDMDDFVLLTIRDNGIGMNLNKYKQHLFKPFTRFTNKASGKGLGLHLVKTMVEKNGGRVQVESEMDTGTSFYLYLKEY